MFRLITSFFSLIFLIGALGWATTIRAQAPETVIPLEGLDPVLLSQGKEVQGDMKYKITRGQFQYLFASAESKAAFEKDPAKYENQLSGHCARMGAPTTAGPMIVGLGITCRPK